MPSARYACRRDAQRASIPCGRCVRSGRTAPAQAKINRRLAWVTLRRSFRRLVSAITGRCADRLGNLPKTRLFRHSNPVLKTLPYLMGPGQQRNRGEPHSDGSAPATQRMREARGVASEAHLRFLRRNCARGGHLAIGVFFICPGNSYCCSCRGIVVGHVPPSAACVRDVLLRLFNKRFRKGSIPARCIRTTT
jgi:hypothetical protein